MEQGEVNLRCNFAHEVTESEILGSHFQQTNEGTVPKPTEPTRGLSPNQRNQRGDCPLWPHDAAFRREIPQTRITAIERTTGGNEISLRNNLTLANNRNI